MVVAALSSTCLTFRALRASTDCRSCRSLGPQVLDCCLLAQWADRVGGGWCKPRGSDGNVMRSKPDLLSADYFDGSSSRMSGRVAAGGAAGSSGTGDGSGCVGCKLREPS